MSSQVSIEVKEVEITTQITRCTCGKPESHRGEPCPTGRVEAPETIKVTMTPSKRDRLGAWLSSFLDS